MLSNMGMGPIIKSIKDFFNGLVARERTQVNSML